MSKIDFDDLPLAELGEYIRQVSATDSQDDLTLQHTVRDHSIGMLPFCVVHKTAVQAIPTGANTAVTWTAAQLGDATSDPYGMHHPASNPTRVTAPRRGWYLAFAQLHWGANSTASQRIGIIRKNGVVDGTNWSAETEEGEGTPFPTTNPVGLFYLNVGDYLECYVTQTSGVNVDILGATDNYSRSKFAVIWQCDNVAPPLPA